MSYIEIDLAYEWWDSVYEDFLQILDAAGVSATAEDINFSGFHSQGDGARFLGNFYLNEVDHEKLRELLPEEDKYLADDLQELAEKHPEIQGRITRCGLGYYYHSNTMHIDEYSSSLSYCDEYTEAFAGDEDALESIFRNLADYLYSQLRDEYEYQLVDRTCCLWYDAKSDLAHAEAELQELRESLIESLPSAEVQVKALDDQLDRLESIIEQETARIEQLADQFYYWKDGKSLTIEEFYNEYF